MLLQFNFQNFKSFREETTLDMTATGISELKHHIIEIGNERVLPVSAIYGANASGKSNIVEAFQYMRHYVLHSFGFGGDPVNKREGFKAVKSKPFLFDSKCKNEPSVFEVYFTVDFLDTTKVYNYGFSIIQSEIVEEWLNYKPKANKAAFKKVFHRTKNNSISYEGLSERQRENIDSALEKEALVVSLGAKMRIKRFKEVYDWFYLNEIADFGSPRSTYFLSTNIPYGFVDNPKVQQDVVRYFSAFDPSIVGFDVQEQEADSENRSGKIKIDALHKMNDSEELVPIPLSSESAGTLKMFALYPLVHDILEFGGVLFVDELNAKLHPLLVRAFMIMFLDPEKNPNHAQLVFTTHDTWHLNNEMLRRDEVWMTEKGNDGVSTLYSLADFVDDNGTKIRKDENYEKNYLLGKYGAIPQMQSIGILKEER